jgi:hypothetical protein
VRSRGGGDTWSDATTFPSLRAGASPPGSQLRRRRRPGGGNPLVCLALATELLSQEELRSNSKERAAFSDTFPPNVAFRDRCIR